MRLTKVQMITVYIYIYIFIALWTCIIGCIKMWKIVLRITSTFWEILILFYGENMHISQNIEVILFRSDNMFFSFCSVCGLKTSQCLLITLAGCSWSDTAAALVWWDAVLKQQLSFIHFCIITTHSYDHHTLSLGYLIIKWS